MPNFLGSDLQVYFLFEKRGPWPPVPSEGVRVVAVDADSYRLVETPFFVRNVAVGDVVRAAAGADGIRWVDERESWSGHQTLRVTPTGAASPATCAEVMKELTALGVGVDELEEYALVAVDVPPEVPPGPVRDLLERGRADGRWIFEEACLGPSW